MKRLFRTIPILFFALMAVSVSAQKNKAVVYEVPEIPVDPETKMVSYTAVVEEKASKDELYKRAMNFMNGNYKNISDVLKKQDNAAGEIEGMHRFKIFFPPNKDGIRTDAGLVSYTINIKVKEGRYKYEITRINWKQPSYYGIEKWMDKESPSYQPNHDYFLIQADEQMRELEEKLKAAMKISTAVEKKADW